MDQATYDNWKENDVRRRRKLTALLDRPHTRILVLRSPKTFQLFDDLMEFCPQSIEVIPGLILGNILSEVFNGVANRTEVEFALLGGDYQDRNAFFEIIEDVRDKISEHLYHDLVANDPTVLRNSILLLDYRFMFHSASIAMRYSTR